MLVLAAALLGIVVVIAALGLSRLGSSEEAAPRDTRGPVVVVLGYNGTIEDVEPLVKFLRDEGRDVRVLPPTGDNTGDLKEQARALGDFVDTVRRDTSATSVDLVGFSAGGVVARLWVSELGGDVQARRVVTIASPHHGTILSTLASEIGLCPAACEQLRPDSDLLASLNAGDETPEGTQWITVRSDSDRTVTPSSSAALEGALNIAVQQYCPSATTGHLQMMSSPVMLASLPLVLDAGAPRAPTEGSVDCG